jgi:antitoxin (DNA-binding transcriptional repressor) of toxin-antitoxin stability system
MSKHTMVYSATDANRHFSKLLKRVENGETILITSRRKVIAEMRPGNNDDIGAMEARKRAHLEALAEQPALNLPRLTQADFYD